MEDVSDLIPPEWGIRRLKDERELRRCGRVFLFTLRRHWEKVAGEKSAQYLKMREMRVWQMRPDGRPLPAAVRSPRWIDDGWVKVVYAPPELSGGRQRFVQVKVEGFVGPRHVRVSAYHPDDEFVNDVYFDFRSPAIMYEDSYRFLRKHPHLREFWFGLSRHEHLNASDYLGNFDSFIDRLAK